LGNRVFNSFPAAQPTIYYIQFQHDQNLCRFNQLQLLNNINRGKIQLLRQKKIFFACPLFSYLPVPAFSLSMSTVFQQILQKGEEIGVKEGEEKNKLKVALNCLIKGMDVQTIAEITDLPVERIELLKSAVKKENAE
jgi:predicted transposase YdaD